MAKRTTPTPEPDTQLLDAIGKANDRIEAERERIFDAGALVEVLSRSFRLRDDHDDVVFRTCNQIYAQLDAIASTLEVITLDLEDAAKLCKGDAAATEVSHG